MSCFLCVYLSFTPHSRVNELIHLPALKQRMDGWMASIQLGFYCGGEGGEMLQRGVVLCAMGER